MDGDELTQTIQWYKNDTLIPSIVGTTYPSNLHKNGDTIKVVVTVSDANLATSKTQTITIINNAPDISFIDDIVVNFGDEVSVSASVNDSDNDALSYHWKAYSGPNLAEVSFAGSTSLSTEFNYLSPGTYYLELEVSDSIVTMTRSVAVTIKSIDVFENFTHTPLSSWPEASAIADVNADGLNDVIISTSFGFNEQFDSSIFVYYQQTDGSLGEAQKLITGVARTSMHVISVAVADINNDGLNDIVFDYANGVGVLTQNISGLFNDYETHTVPNNSFNTTRVLAADFNNDGLNDILAAGHLGGLYLFLQNNNGELNDGFIFAVNQGYNNDLTFGDLNNDGLNDIVVASSSSLYSKTISVHYQQTNNTFSATTSYSLGVDYHASSLSVGDINNDGRDDLVVTYGGNSPTSKIAIFIQNNTAGLNSPIHLLSDDIPKAVKIADINNDNLLDIVVSHDGWSSAGVYFQQEDNSIQVEQLYAFYPSSNPQSLSVGDINNDGKLDIVGAHSNGVSILIHK